MTLPQFLSFASIALMMIFFVWGRLRYDMVAMLALAASVAAGTVAPEVAFSGFSADIFIIVASALVVSAAVSRSSAIEVALRWLERRLPGLNGQLLVLVGLVTLLSAPIKMPMAFGSLLGGLITMVGTSPNIIVSRVRE